jgi:penicillin amidase
MKDTKECLQNFHDNWSVPIQNFICADQDHVELLHAGRVPKRRIGEGRFIMDGREEHDSLAETIPDKEHPHATPGRDGFILSANQKIEGPNYPYYLGWDYEEAYRGLMIRRRLREKPKLSPEDMLRIQNDDYDPQAELALKWMLQALKRDGLSAEQKRAAEDLGKWDFHVLAGKHEPALFKAWFYAFRGKVADGAMPKELRVTWLLERLSQNPEDSDRQWLKGSLSDVVTEAYREAFASVGSKSWAEYNQAQLPHVARLPGWGSPVLQMDGSGQSIRGNHGRHGPVYKAVFAFGDPMRIWMQVPGGNEGDPLNPDYGRFAQDWAAGQMREVEYDKTWDEAKGKAVRTVTLRPAGG